jgi:mRNA interferase ChpB
MARRPIERGDVYLVDLTPSAGKEQQGKRPVLVISTADFNRQFGKCLIAPITQGGDFARYGGYAVSLIGTGMRTQGAALLTDLRTLDLVTRKAKHLEQAPKAVMDDLLSRLITIFD